MGHLRQHSFTGDTDHDFTGLSNNYLPKLNSSGTGITSSQLIDDGTNIGINIASPLAKLDVRSDRADGSGSAFKIKTSAHTETTSIRNDGYTELNKLGIGVIMGDQSNNYLFYVQNRLIQFSNSATFTGFHANRNGSGISIRATSANDVSLVESTGTMTFSTNWDNDFNSSGSLAMLINGDNQYVGIGMPTSTTIPGAKLNVRGSGNTGNGIALLVENSDGTDMMSVNNAGLSMFGTTSTASTFGGVVGAVHGETTITDNTTYNSSAAFTMTFNPSLNGVTYNRALNSAIIKYGAGNTSDVVGTTSLARNDGSGSITNLVSIDAQTFLNSNASVTNLYGLQAQTTLQASGTVTNQAAIRLISSANQAGTTITNMYGLLVSTPVNTGGAVTNTYGAYLQSNTLGSSTNWGIYQDGSSNNNYFAGKIGINGNPTTGDRLYISAGSGLDGAINIAAANLANNGYALLAQGSSSSSNYYGIWSDAQGGATSTNMAFRGSALAQAVTNNYGGHFTARNGSGVTAGVYGIATGGDSVAASDSAGVIGINSSEVSTNKKGVWGYLNSNVNNGTGYGGKFEAGNSGTNAVNYGVHGLANGSAASATNYAGYFQANGGSGATNYAIVTNGGTSGFGTTAPTDMVHINGSTGSTQLRLEQSHTPTSSGSTSGNIGSIAWDNNYFYVKTNLGWGRVALDYAF